MSLHLALADAPAMAVAKHRREAMPRRKMLTLSATAAIGLSLLPAPAMAEGGFGSSLSGVTTGFASRTWYDSAKDNNVTLTAMQGCSRDDGANFTVNVELRRQRTALPDVSYGTRDLSACATRTAEGAWSNPGAGTFFDKFHHYTFGRISARYVGVSY
jgi:hypothetical protein